jgi:hypothetical protein
VIIQLSILTQSHKILREATIISRGTVSKVCLLGRKIKILTEDDLKAQDLKDFLEEILLLTNNLIQTMKRVRNR